MTNINQNPLNPVFNFDFIEVNDIINEAEKLAEESEEQPQHTQSFEPDSEKTQDESSEPDNETPPEEEPDSLDMLIQSAIIDPNADIREPPTVISIGGVPACTLGSFSIVKGKKKSTKTFLIGSLTAAAISRKCNLSVVAGSMPPNSTVIYIDTEQSQFHATRSVKRIVRQAASKNFKAYGLRPFKTEIRVEMITRIISRLTTPAFIVIDGLRDLLSNGINDEAEATEKTDLLMAWSHDKKCHIVLALHENKNDTNARGHIGTEITNKAESIIRVEKKGIVIEVTGECRDIEFDPFQYIINDEGLPEIVFQGDVKEKNKRQSYYDCFIAILPGMVNMRYTELYTEYSERAGVSVPTAKRHIAEALKLKVIYKDGYQNYRVTPVESSIEDSS